MQTKRTRGSHLYKATLLVSVLFIVSLQKLCAQVTPDGTSAVGTKTAVTAPAGYGTVTSTNYVRTWVPQQGYTLATDVSSTSRSVAQVNRFTAYVDGLGRPFQTVSWQASPNSKDIVASQIYDEFGREQYQYLPYQSTTNTGTLKTNPFAEQSTFYTSTYPAEQGAYKNERYFYSHTVFEPSPLNRPAKTFAPGNSWAGSEIAANGITRTAAEKAISVQYLVNTKANDGVRIWDIGFAAFGDANNIPTSASGRVYEDGQLFKTVTVDEANNAVVEYKDKEEHVVLKKVQIGSIASDYSGTGGFLCTYYVYDDLGQLRFVIPPKAVAKMSNWVLSTDIVKELCFRYEYDERGRMKAKKVPGSDWVYLVYDNRDRLIYTQDGNMRGKSPQQWAYTFYDQINRPVETGIMSYSGTWANLVSAASAKADGATTATVTGTKVNTLPADLLITSRDYTTNPYNATNSITFDNGFESEDGASFTAEIVSSPASTYTVQQSLNTKVVPTTGTYTYYPLTYSYYDNYDAGDKNFSTSKNFTTAYNSNLATGDNTIGVESVATAGSGMTKGLTTGSRVRVIEDPSNLNAGAWLETVTYYDDKGRMSQVQSDNYKGGVDIALTRYNFTNKAVSTYLTHSNPAAGKGNTNRIGVATAMLYDHVGRVKTVTKSVTYGGTTYTRTLVQNTYDALGQLKTKAIGQKSSSDTNPMENDGYTYNIRGWLKGVNWYNGQNYGSQQNAGSNKWFAFDLSYDWGMNGSTQYNGNIAGQRWMSAGDGKERAYGYSYDQANRLLKGDFTQKNGSWGTDPILNFNVVMGNGTAGSAYDENGNIRQMQQYGLAGVASQLIDNLEYRYTGTGELSNKLSYVKDNASQPSVNLGDFNDKNGETAVDYGYDKNGNLITDKNKRLNGATGVDLTNTGSGAGAIIYNHLNLPWQITVKNDDGSAKGTITYIYDATGNKLEKRVSEAASATNGNVPKQTQTAYLGGFVYENNVLQFFGHEEGRVRPVQAIINGTPTTNLAWDYFLKDHLGNVRMVLTDEQKQDVYPAATLEASGLSTEKNYYDIQDANIVNNPASLPSATNGTYYNNNGNPPYNTNPNVTTSAQSARMYKLNGGSGVKMGLGIAIKVMAGDNVSVWGKSFYHLNSGQTVSNTYPVNSALLALLTSFAGTGAVSGKGVTGATLNGSSATTGPLTTIVNSPATPGGSVPKAGINWILFDEQFRPVTTSAAYGYSAVGSSADAVKTHTLSTSILQNGYLYVYCSNESNVDVFFDNLQLIHNHGPLTEETHYYPFGLTMAGISSKALGFGDPGNKRKFNKGSELQSGEFSDGSGLQLYSTEFRSLDPQLGRWWQVDPKPNDAESPYNSMGNNPILHNDPLGDTTVVNKRGYIIKQYGSDNLVFLQKGKKLTGIGEFGKTINANKILKNLLKANTAEAKKMGVIPFFFKVRGGGDWDLKANKNTIYGLAEQFDAQNSANPKTQFEFNGKQMNAEDVGNFHFGVVGEATGLFTDEFMLRQAGAAQIRSGTSTDPSWIKYRTTIHGSGPFQITTKTMLRPYGDDPQDQRMIKDGFGYYNNNKDELKQPEEE